MIFNQQNSIIRKFAEQSIKYPDKVAIDFDGKEFSYGEIASKAQKVQNILIQNGIKAGEVVALDCISPVQVITALLGIMKNNNICTNLGSKYSTKYKNDILKFSKASCLLTNASFDSIEFTGKVILIDDNKDEECYSCMDTVTIGDFNLLSYYPDMQGYRRGVLYSETHVCNWVEFNINKLKMDFEKSLFIFYPGTETDFPLWISNLATGGRVEFYSISDENPINVAEKINEVDVGNVIIPTSILKALVESCGPNNVFKRGVSSILSYGEDVFDASEFKIGLKEKQIRWHNYFGYPQNHIVTTIEGEDKIVMNHVGRPISGTSAYILDENMQLVSINVTGELYLSGKGVLDGYYMDQKNKERFFENSFVPGTKMYKTQYRAFWKEDGKLCIQNQQSGIFTIKGLSISCHEIESIFTSHPNVQDCAVISKKTSDGMIRPIAFLTLKNAIDNECLDEYLKHYFPKSVLPIGVVRITSIPRKLDGEIDYQQLENMSYFLDSVIIAALEGEIKTNCNLDHVVIVAKENLQKVPPIHTRDIISGEESVNSHNPKITDTDQRNKETEDEDSPLAIAHGGELVAYEGEPKTLMEVLLRAAANNGNEGVICIHSDGQEYFVSYSELLQQAKKILGGLRKVGLKPQEKVIFQFDSDEDYICAFWGCILGGFIPVPVTVPRSFTSNNNEVITLRSIWEMTENPIVLTNKNLESSIKHLFDDFDIKTIEEMRSSEAENSFHKCNPDDMAIILFTSGSTGKPKGVVQCHKTILAREKGAIQFSAMTTVEVMVNWLPMEHVVGLLLFHILPMYLMGKQIHIRTDFILQNPLRWLDILSKYKSTITWAPNFAFGLVNEKMRNLVGNEWDLSSIRMVINAGEAVNDETCKRFLRNLKPYGLNENSLKPEWGMAETCSVVIASDVFTLDSEKGVQVLDKRTLGGIVKNISRESANSISMVEIGRPYPGTSIRIVDESNCVIREGIVGRLQIKGVTVLPEYYKNTDANNESFTKDGWFDTGDLGFLINGIATFTGRMKDVIIVNGMNYSSSEIETVVEGVENVEISYTVAYATRQKESNSDKVVIFYNSRLLEPILIVEQIKRIRKAIIEKVGINVDTIIPIRKEDVPKTNIGKIQRSKLGKLFEAGNFDKETKQVDIWMENENTLPSWFFQKKWTVKAPFAVQDKSSINNCLIFEDNLGVGQAIAEKLKKQGCRCINVKNGKEYKKYGESIYEIDYASENDYILLLKDIQLSGIRIDDIFHFLSLGVLNKEEYMVEGVRIALEKGIFSLLYLIHALDENYNSPIRLFIVSNSSQNILPNDKVSYGKCTISGFIKSVILEMPWINFRYVDVELDQATIVSRNFETCSLQIVSEWKFLVNDAEVAYRKGQRLVSRLSRINVQKEIAGDRPIKHEGVYLVAGGLGGIGQNVVRWLMQHYDAKVIVVGRTILPEKGEWQNIIQHKLEGYKRLQSYKLIEATPKGEFIYVSGDISDEYFVNGLELQAQLKWNKLIDGVFCLAGEGYNFGEIDKHWAIRENKETFEEMFGSKLYGTINLFKIIERNPQAIFVAFSSIMSFFGAAAYSTYSAANSFVEGFCLNKRENGYPFIYCLSWSSWQNTGMSEDYPSHVTNSMVVNGYERISINSGLNSMAVALRCDKAQMYIGLDGTKSNIRKFMDEYPISTQILDVYYSMSKDEGNSNINIEKSIVDVVFKNAFRFNTKLCMHNIDTMPMVQGKVDILRLESFNNNSNVSGNMVGSTETEKRLAKIWENVLGVTAIGVEDSFFELGGNSINASNLCYKIFGEFNISVKLGDVLRAPTIREIAKHIEGNSKEVVIPITIIEDKEYYSLSSAQKRLYILDQFEGIGTGYNIYGAMGIEGELDKDRLEMIFRQLVKRHDVLRTSFMVVNGEPVQKINKEVDFSISYIDQYNGNINDTINQFVKPWDLSKAPLLRVGLVKTADKKHVIMYDMHHIIADGISLGILSKEFRQLYNNIQLPELKLQYKDFVSWQNELYKTEKIKKQESYWIDMFTKNTARIPILDLHTDMPRPLKQSFEGDSISLTLDAELTNKLKRYSAQTGSTLYMVLLAAYKVFLSKYTGQEDIIIGSPVAGRSHPDIEGMIGMFVNTLAIRSYPVGDKTFNKFMEEVKEICLQAFENQDYQFEELIGKLDIIKDLSRNPLFETMFALHNVENAYLEVPELKFVPYNHETKSAKFDISLIVLDTNNTLEFVLEYCTSLFKEETIQNFMKYLIKILNQIVNSPNKKLSEFELISESEKEQILVESNCRNIESYKKIIAKMKNTTYEQVPPNSASIFVLNKYKQYQPIGLIGEIYLGVNNIDLYNTKLRGRWLANGNIEIIEGKEKVKKSKRTKDMDVESEITKTIKNIWVKVLKRDNIKTNDDFFDLGGQSFDLINVIFTIKEELNIEIPLSKIIINPTINQMAKFIKMGRSVNRYNILDEPYILFNKGKSENIFAFPPAYAYGIVYAKIAETISDYCFYCFNYLEEEDKIKQYVKMIIDVQKDGPYILFGFSAGGNLAVKVANQMENQGYKVSNIILMDSYIEIQKNSEENKLRLISEINNELDIYYKNINIHNTLNNNFRKKVIEKIEDYLNYFNNIVHKENIYANIHLIKARDNLTKKNWKYNTSGSYLEYDGLGTHHEMIDKNHVKSNSKIINNILSSVDFKKYRKI